MIGYGLCPKCGENVSIRERRPNGNDNCENGHVFPSIETLPYEKGKEMMNYENLIFNCLNAHSNENDGKCLIAIIKREIPGKMPEKEIKLYERDEAMRVSLTNYIDKKWALESFDFGKHSKPVFREI